MGWQTDKIYFLTRFLKDWNLRFFKHKPAFALGDADWEFWTESGGIRHFQVSTSIHLIIILYLETVGDNHVALLGVEVLVVLHEELSALNHAGRHHHPE